MNGVYEMGRIGQWKKKSDYPNYVVYSLPQKPMHNPHSIIVKTEEGRWVTFIDMGDGGVSVINRGGTKAENLVIARKYMRSHNG